MAESRLQVTVCGGGNGAHVTAGYLGAKGVRVNVLTRRPSEWASQIEVSTAGSSWEAKGTMVGGLQRSVQRAVQYAACILVSANAADVVPGSDVVLICAPANAHPALLRAVAPHVDRKAAVGALYAQGGFDWAARKALGDKVDHLRFVFGLQNIPWICKAVEYGKRARILGPKDNLWVAASPPERAAECTELITSLFDIPARPVPNFLNLTLTPSNQIIHPARYFGIFRDWDGRKTYTKEAVQELAKRRGLTLYSDMDEFSAELLAVLDNELQQIKCGLERRYPSLDLSRVLPIAQRVVEQYGADVADRSSLRAIFATNRGYAGCGTPLKEVLPGEFQPAVESRLFWEDIPYGLCILKSLAQHLALPTPGVDLCIRWHQQFMGKEYLLPSGTLNPALLHETAAPEAYGLASLDDIVRSSLPAEARARL